MAEKMTDSGLKYDDLEEGTGTEAVAGTQVTVHYAGWLEDGSKFDSSLDRISLSSLRWARDRSFAAGMKVCRG